MSETQALSLGGNIWNFPSVNDAECARMADKYDIPQYLSRMLYLRGVDIVSAESFLNPKLQSLMPDPYVMKDMQKAAERIADAVIKSQKIAIIGDYDVDGATSTSILTRFFKQVGIMPQIHIPSREEGYGPSELAFAEFGKTNIEL
ncbi:MAG: single-stranded-DNA-specific exonuclease RecJ, partial [Alphaproteobacteria bacterium]|nr:single-stranded-DNA-specific exonuclease RecJ [Alphaproteobacteria bacterium]